MQTLRVQYVLFFAVLGSLMPYLSVYLEGRGLARPEIGLLQATAQTATVLTPAVLALIADTRVAPRRLIALAFTVSAAALVVFGLVRPFPAVLGAYAVHALAFIPIKPLQDGLFFSEQRWQRLADRDPPGYHLVRVWGTVGFILPSLGLFAFLRYREALGLDLWIILIAALVAEGLALINTLFLPDPKRDESVDKDVLPTRAAARLMTEPHVAVFCLAVLLMHTGSSAYGVFFPLYLTEAVGVDKQWIGLIANLGVTVEIFFMLAFGWLFRRLGLRWLMLLGVLCMGGRMALLAAVPTVATAVAVQALHGMVVLAIFVAPPIYLNRHAGEAYRHSVQGLYMMAVVGVGRILGGAVGGKIADVSLLAVMGFGGGLCVLSACLFGFAFREPDHRIEP